MNPTTYNKDNNENLEDDNIEEDIESINGYYSLPQYLRDEIDRQMEKDD